MSYHILHIFEHGSYLRLKNNNVILESKNTKRRSLPTEDIKAIIIAAKGINISAPLLSALLANDAVLLHCDEKFKPIGVTHNTSRTIDPKLLYAQIEIKKPLVKRIWEKIIRTKANNQREVLRTIHGDKTPLDSILARNKIDESHVARVYWQAFFKAQKIVTYRRSQRHKGDLNMLLNYGYAVIGSLVHRSVVVHGLLTHLGIKHKPSYRGHPLVYDLMEPLRPMVDFFTLAFTQEVDLKDHDSFGLKKQWAKYLAHALVKTKFNRSGYYIKLVNAIDKYISCYANAILLKSDKELWTPSMGVKGWRHEQVCAKSI